MASPFVVVDGPPVAEICESIYQYTLAHPDGEVFVDVAAFKDIGVTQVLCLLTELPAVERFVNPDFSGVFRVVNASWAVQTAINAVFNTVIYRSAPNTQFKVG